MYRSHVLICGGTGCTSSGSAADHRRRSKRRSQRQGLSDESQGRPDRLLRPVRPRPDHDRLSRGLLSIPRSSPRISPRSSSEHLLKGRIVKRLLYKETVQEDDTSSPSTRPTSTKSSTGSRCATAASSTRKTSTSTSPIDGYEALGKVPDRV